MRDKAASDPRTFGLLEFCFIDVDFLSSDNGKILLILFIYWLGTHKHRSGCIPNAPEKVSQNWFQPRRRSREKKATAVQTHLTTLSDQTSKQIAGECMALEMLRMGTAGAACVWDVVVWFVSWDWSEEKNDLFDCEKGTKRRSIGKLFGCFIRFSILKLKVFILW